MRIIPSWHPTYAFFRNPYEWATFDVDLDRFARMIRGELEAGPKHINITPSVRAVSLFHKRALRNKEPVALDIETVPRRPGKEWGYTGKKPTEAKLQLLGLGFCDEAMSLQWGFGTSAVERAVKALLEDTRVVKILQNGDYFDLIVLRRFGVTVNNVVDTRDARRALVATSPTKLAYTGSIYTDYHAWKNNDSDDDKGLVFTTNLKKKMKYNGHDCVVTARVWRGLTQEPDWNTPRMRALYEHQRKLAVVGAAMHEVGVRIDKKRRAALAEELEGLFDKRERKFLRSVGIKDFKCNPNYMRALIFEKHATGKYAAFARFNLPDPIDPAFYKDKEMSTIKVDTGALTLLLIDPTVPQELKTIVQNYWDAEEVWKMRSTFVVSKRIDQAIGRDGRLRAGWNSCGTDTGRFACSEPNLMNIPASEDVPWANVRSMYVAAPGFTIIGADYSQLELRVMHAVAKDEALGQALASADVYTAEAIEYFGLPADTTKATIKPDARKSAKVIRLARQYGAGKKKGFQIAVMINRQMTFLMFIPLMNAFDRRNWRTVAYWEEEMQRVLKTGYSESRIMGRRREYPVLPERSEVANYPIQGTAADIKNLALIEVHENLKKYRMKSRIIFDLHDAIYVEAHKKEIQAVESIMHAAMEKEYLIDGGRYAFPAKFKESECWGDLA